MWTYHQLSGLLEHNGQEVDFGWCGCQDGINIPGMQAIPNVGPIPRGNYTIIGPPQDTTTHGPFVLKISAKPGTNTFGRSGFLIHGASSSSPATSSEGCLIFPRATRQKIWESNDFDLQVVGI